MKNIVYWTSTLLLSAFVVTTAFAYWGHPPVILAAFTPQGSPGYIAGLIGMAKLLGVILLLLPGLPLSKEWAYAGFTFMCIRAIVSLLLMHRDEAVAAPALALTLLLISYFARPSTRRLSFGYRLEYY
jgi:hypothetical protein